MKEDKLAKLVTLSNFMRWFCVALMIVVILAGVVTLVGMIVGATWFFDGPPLESLFEGVSFSPDTVGAFTRSLILLVNAITLFFTCRGLWSLVNLFDAFSRREILTAQTSRLLRQAGSSFLIVAIYGVAARMISILLLTMGNPSGEKQLTIGFGSEQLFAILLAGTLFAIGHVLSIAASVDEENKGFI